MMSKYKEKAIQLISVDPNSGRYMLTPEASDFIRNIPGPIGVVSVAGLYRTGKSYLLNQMLLNRSNGFGVGPTVNPCTKGLWCWGTPIKGESADGQKLNIIVIDTEGIGALDEDQTHDTRIFTLAILASSCFIYNSVGSIDENAVQNLSLVVNLTKHIQLRTQKSVDDEDPDKIASYFPTFFWVVRDFSLQISDTEGNKMTSKEYLQKALAPQKGFSQDIEQKNRIRRMLTTFFKQRECFTLVRPLIDESQLQDLDKMSFDDLRPEFVNQVINFRKRVTGRMKPKMMNGQKLSGELYLSMLSSYVGAINDGAIPSIQNAWNYMCTEQCTKVMTESLETFETELKEIRIPCSADEMNKGIETAQEAALEKFKKKSIGDDAEKYYKQLQAKMRERAKQIRKVNAEEGKSAFKKYITPYVTSIQQKVSKDQYSSFQEFLQQLKKFEDKITKQGPNYVDSNLNCQLCVNKILGQGVIYLSKRMKNDKQHIKKTLEERIKIHENQNENLKKQRDSDQSNMRQKLSQLDKEKLELAFKLEKIQIQLERTTRERNTEEEQLNRNLTAKKFEIEQIRKEFEAKVTEASSRAEEKSKILHEQKSNWEKEKAIYELKVRQQSEKLDELEKKLQNSSAKLLSEASELSQKHREQYSKLQEQIQELSRNLAESKERNERYEETESQMKEKFATLTEKYDAVDRKLRQQTSSKARELEKMKNEHEAELIKVKNEMMQNLDDNDKLGRQMEEKMKKQDTRARELADELKNVKNKYEKQNQVLNQELEFTKRSLDESKQKLIETKAIYESKIAAIEADSGLQREEQVQRKIAELKSTHEEEMRSFETQFKENQKSLNFQIENLTKCKNELELQLRVLGEQLNNEKAENEEIKQNLNEMNKKLENEMKAVQRQKMSELIAKEGFFNERIATLERQLEETRDNYHVQKVEVESRVNNEITHIKNYYEMEKEKQETRYAEEKDKLKKKYTEMIYNLENRLKQEAENYEEERQRMESEFQNQLEAEKITVNSLTHEKETLSREKVNLEQKYASLNERYNKMETDLNDRLQKLVETTKIQRDNLVKKLEELQFNKNEMQKQILSLTHERDQYRNQSQKQSAQIQQLKSFNTNLSDRYESTKTSLEERLKESQEKYMKEKSRFETENALLQQKKDFSEQKIVEIEKDLKSMRERQQEQMRIFKERYEEQLSIAASKHSIEKKSYEDKIQKLKKLSAEAQTGLIRQLSELSKAKAVDEQKIEYLEKKLMQTQSKTAVEISTLGQQLKTMKEKFTVENTQLKARIGELQQDLHSKQSQLMDQKNNYEITVALNESKIKNLKEWGDNAIFEKSEMIRNLQKQLDDSRKRNENEKSSQQLTHQEILTRMESKYRSEITQLNQDVTKRTQQIEYMTREHERTIKDLNEKLALQRQNRVAMETKFARVENDYLQKQNKFTAEVDKLRSEKEAMSFEVQKLISKEKELSKMKISEFERKMIESDKQKQSAVFEKEKQEARWKMEKTTFEQKLEEYKELLDREKNESKRLMKDNEKLKAEKKKNTSYIKQNQTTIMTREVSAENKENSLMQ